MKKMWFIVLFVLVVLCSACSKEYYVYMTGFDTDPKIAIVNEPVNIYVYCKEYSSDQLNKKFVWKIDGFEEEFETAANGLSGIVFDSPGYKYVTVVAKSDYSNFISNELQFVVNVRE